MKNDAMMMCRREAFVVESGCCMELSFPLAGLRPRRGKVERLQLKRNRARKPFHSPPADLRKERFEFAAEGWRVNCWKSIQVRLDERKEFFQAVRLHQTAQKHFFHIGDVALM